MPASAPPDSLGRLARSGETTAEWGYYDPTPGRRRAARGAVIIAIVFYVGSLVAMFGVSIANGYGTGFGDGRLAQSCFTPGGPYYPSDLPLEERTCPQGPEGTTGEPDAPPFENPVKDLALIALSLGTAGAVLGGWIWMLKSIGTI